MTRYRWVDSRKAEGFPVTHACAVAQTSTSAFYDWLAAGRQGPTPEGRDEAYLVNAIIDIHRGSGGTYGVPRVSVALRRAGWPVNRKKVERLMRENNVVGLPAPASRCAHHNPRRDRASTCQTVRGGKGRGA